MLLGNTESCKIWCDFVKNFGFFEFKIILKGSVDPVQWSNAKAKSLYADLCNYGIVKGIWS